MKCLKKKKIAKAPDVITATSESMFLEATRGGGLDAMLCLKTMAKLSPDNNDERAS